MCEADALEAFGDDVVDPVDQFLHGPWRGFCGHRSIPFVLAQLWVLAHSGALASGGSGLGVGSFRDRDTGNRRDAVVADELVQERTDEAARDGPDDVDPELTQASRELAEADGALDEHGADLPGGIERGAGDGANQDDDPVDDEPDDDPGEACRGTTVDGRLPV